MPPKKAKNEITPKARETAEKQIRARQREIKYDLRDFTIDYIVREFKNRRFHIPEYQRKFIWKQKNRSRFIESVLLGLPIPLMFVADTDDGRMEIVDGAQRICTLESFVDNAHELGDLQRLPSLNGFKFKDLPESSQRKFGNKPLRMVFIDEGTTMKSRQEIFDRVNTSGVEANSAEIRRGTYQNSFMKFIIECAKDPLLEQLCPLSKNMIDRRQREELVLRFFTYSERLDDFRHDVDNFLDKYVADQDDDFDKDRLHREYVAMLQFVERHFPGGFAKSKTAKATPRVRFEALSVGVNLALREYPDLSPRNMDWLDSPEFKDHTTTHASNSLPKLKGRIEYVRTQLLAGADAC